MADLLEPIPQTSIVPPGRYGIDAIGVVVTLVEGARIVSIVATQAALLETATRAYFGIALPTGPACVAASDLSIVGTGPGRWLAVGFGPDDLEDRLAGAFASAAAVCDQSDAYVLFDVAGPNARDALAKGVAIDLDPRAFGPGDGATTSIALVGATLWQMDDAPTFRFAIARSFAPSFSRFLVTSAAEFGCSVAAAPPRS